MDDEKKARYDKLIEAIAELWPSAWLGLAIYRRAAGSTHADINHALRRAVEEQPFDKSVWLLRASVALSQGDTATQVAALVSAVEADPTDLDLVRETSLTLCQYVDAHKHEIPPARRGVYVASVRSYMERLSDELDATGLSRLAWLFLLSGDLDGAWKYANQGLAKEVTNPHCLRIVERLDGQGWSPAS
jgi:hypothetical protein